MSKNIKIAALGIAALATAAAPMMAMAEDKTTQQDTLSIKINEVCSFGYINPTTDTAVVNVAAPAHAAAEGAGTWSGDTLSKTMTNGIAVAALGTTTLKVYCNDNDGYTITSSFSDTENNLKSGDNFIPMGKAIAITASEWGYKIDSVGMTGGNQVATAGEWIESMGIIAKQDRATDKNGDTYVITYGVSVDDSQEAGTYTGTITYTLASVDN